MPNPRKPQKPKRFAETVERFREDIGLRTHIRGTTRKFARKPRPHPQEIHAYFVDPRYDLSSREFFSRFRATINAAASRAFSHAYAATARDILLHPKSVSPKWLPSIAFSYIPLAHDTASVKQERKFEKRRKEKPTFKPRRETLEWALVHGRERQTFRESYALTSKQSRQYLFVDLTKKEFLQIHRGVDSRLRRKHGIGLKELFEMGGPKMEGEPEAESHKRYSRAWEIVLKELKLKEKPVVGMESFGFVNPAWLLLVSPTQQLMERKALKKLAAFREKLLEAEKKRKK